MNNEMVETHSYSLSPTALIPNSPHPLLHYKNSLTNNKDIDPAEIYDLFSTNGWQTQWIFRYGPTQPSHYHSATHECMAVLSRSATIRFGAADDKNEESGLELRAETGDVFLIPAGVAHKTFDPDPADSKFALLTPGDGHGIEGHNAATGARDILARMDDLAGFTMMGAYPKSSSDWDFAQGGEHVGAYQSVWDVAKPDRDPVLGLAKQGLCGLWR